MKTAEIKSLLTLLSDDDPETAGIAMTGLLALDESELEAVLAAIQEASDPNLRMKSHQLQGVIKARSIRKNFTMNFECGIDSLMKSLLRLHLQWYDKDDTAEISDLWNQLLEEAEYEKISSLGEMAEFMKLKGGFRIFSIDEIYPDYYCIGYVLRERTGADLILCAIACSLAFELGFNLETVKTDAGFGVADGTGRIVLPSSEWATVSDCPELNTAKFDSPAVCRMAGLMLFLSAVTTESFRYIYTLGTCLIEDSPGKSIIDALPYPYGGSLLNVRENGDKEASG